MVMQPLYHKRFPSCYLLSRKSGTEGVQTAERGLRMQRWDGPPTTLCTHISLPKEHPERQLQGSGSSPRPRTTAWYIQPPEQTVLVSRSSCLHQRLRSNTATAQSASLVTIQSLSIMINRSKNSYHVLYLCAMTFCAEHLALAIRPLYAGRNSPHTLPACRQ
ncbi:hypothetical protein F5Y05DRAFT_220926 [Hypoxylon sp. FL0543]|nr:hypothetical protein F5Y05DRAFT_220926 [Hypoxylon sp. FL0543]